MMIKFRPAVYANHRRKDGSIPVKIVVYFKGKERKLPTHIVAEPKDLTRALKLKQGERYDAAMELIRKMREACADIPYFDSIHQDVDFVVNHIKAKLAKEEFRLDFFQFAYDSIKTKKEGTRALYVQTLRAFGRFLGKEEIDVNLITKGMAAEFVDYVNAEKKIYRNYRTGEQLETKKEKAVGSQARIHITRLNALYKAAKRKYNDEDSGRILIPRSPFANHELPSVVSRGQKPLSQELVQRLISAETSIPSVRVALDACVVSFGLMGVNIADLLEMQPPKDGVVVYYRKKTRDRRADRAEMIVRVPECLRPYIDRLTDRRCNAWLGKLHKTTDPSTAVNRGLARWCEAEKVERFTFYALRKSWATIARKTEGVDKSIVDEGLAHVGDFSLTDIYAERPWEKINEANRKVLEQFQW